MANISVPAMGIKLGVIKKDNPAGRLGLPASVGFIVDIPNIVFFNSPCKTFGHFLVDHRQLGGIEEVTTCHLRHINTPGYVLSMASSAATTAEKQQ